MYVCMVVVVASSTHGRAGMGITLGGGASFREGGAGGKLGGGASLGRVEQVVSWGEGLV